MSLGDFRKMKRGEREPVHRALMSETQLSGPCLAPRGGRPRGRCLVPSDRGAGGRVLAVEEAAARGGRLLWSRLWDCGTPRAWMVEPHFPG